MPRKPIPITASPQAVADWIERHGGDMTALAPVLGRDRNQIATYRDKGAPRAIALAMAAIDAGLPALGETEQTTTETRTDMRAAKRAARRANRRGQIIKGLHYPR